MVIDSTGKDEAALLQTSMSKMVITLKANAEAIRMKEEEACFEGVYSYGIQPKKQAIVDASRSKKTLV